MNAPTITGLLPAELHAWQITKRCDHCGAEPGDACGSPDDVPLAVPHKTRGQVAKRLHRERAKARPPVPFAPSTSQLVHRIENMRSTNNRQRARIRTLVKAVETARRRAADEQREAAAVRKELDRLRKQLRALGGAA